MPPTIDHPPYTPPGWPTVVPRIVVPDAKGLVEFVTSVFNATGAYNESAPSEIRIGEALIMISAAAERDPSAAFLYVYVEDTDATYRRAMDSGATSVEEPAEMPYGDRRAMVEDRWGNTWQIATHRAFHGA